MGNILLGFLKGGGKILKGATKGVAKVGSRSISRSFSDNLVNLDTTKSNPNSLGNVVEKSKQSSRDPETGKDNTIKKNIVRKSIPSKLNSLFLTISSALSYVFLSIFLLIASRYIIVPIFNFVTSLIASIRDKGEQLRHDHRDRMKIFKKGIFYYIDRVVFFFVSFIFALFECIVTIISKTWEWLFILFFLWIIFLILFFLENFTKDIAYVTSLTVKTGSDVYDNTVVRGANLLLDVFEVTNGVINMATYQIYAWIMLFINFSIGKHSVEFEPFPTFTHGRSLLEGDAQDIDRTVFMQSLKVGFGYMALFGQLLFALQYNFTSLLLFFLFPYLLVWFLPYFGNVLNKIFCIAFSFECAFLEVAQTILLDRFNLIFGFFGIQFDMTCSAEKLSTMDIPILCKGKLLEFTASGIFRNLGGTTSRRLQALSSILLLCKYDHSNDVYLEYIGDRLVHTEHHYEELACPNSRGILDPARNARFMFDYDIPDCFGVCVLNTALNICHLPDNTQSIENLGKCDSTLPPSTLYNFTIPTVADTVKKKKQKRRDLSSKKMTRQETVQMIRNKIGTDKFYMFDRYECDLSSIEFGNSWLQTMDTICIIYAIVLHAQEEGTHHDTFRNALKHGRNLESSTVETITSFGRHVNQVIRIYHVHLNEGYDEKESFEKTLGIYHTKDAHFSNGGFVFEGTWNKHQALSRRRLEEYSACDVQCEEGYFCCYNRVQCVTRYEDCTDSKDLSIANKIGLRLAEIQAYVYNFDFVGDIANAKACQENYWDPEPETNPLASENLLDGTPDYSKIVYCFPTIPPILERFSMLNASIDPLFDALCPVTNGSNPECICNRYSRHVGPHPDTLYFGFIPMFSITLIKQGLTWLIDFSYCFFPPFYYFIWFIWSVLSVIVGKAYLHPDVIPYYMDFDTTRACLLWNPSGFVFLIISLFHLLILLSGASHLMDWAWWHLTPGWEAKKEFSIVWKNKGEELNKTEENKKSI